MSKIDLIANSIRYRDIRIIFIYLSIRELIM